jgi:hypothetical protein
LMQLLANTFWGAAALKILLSRKPSLNIIFRIFFPFF